MIRSFFRRAGLAGLAAATALSLGTYARADIAYGYAEQTISNVTVSGVTFSGSPITSTQDGYTVNGSGLSASNPTDAPQTGVGVLPPENTFTRTVTGNPPSGGSSLTRGDVLISGLGTAAATASGVTESYLNATSGSETGFSTLTATIGFTPTATGAINIGYSYANDIFVATTGGGAATASYNFDFTIKNNATGLIVFFYGSSPASANTNATLSAPPQGGELIRTGSDVVTTSSLTAGTSYTLTFTNKTSTSVTVTAVPEPEPMTLSVLAGGIMFVAEAVRRRWRRRASL